MRKSVTHGCGPLFSLDSGQPKKNTLSNTLSFVLFVLVSRSPPTVMHASLTVHCMIFLLPSNTYYTISIPFILFFFQDYIVDLPLLEFFCKNISTRHTHTHAHTYSFLLVACCFFFISLALAGDSSFCLL